MVFFVNNSFNCIGISIVEINKEKYIDLIILISFYNCFNSIVKGIKILFEMIE